MRGLRHPIEALRAFCAGCYPDFRWYEAVIWLALLVGVHALVYVVTH